MSFCHALTLGCIRQKERWRASPRPPSVPARFAWAPRVYLRRPTQARGHGRPHSSERGSTCHRLTVPALSLEASLGASWPSLASLHLPPVQYRSKYNCPSTSTELENLACANRCRCTLKNPMSNSRRGCIWLQWPRPWAMSWDSQFLSSHS